MTVLLNLEASIFYTISRMFTEKTWRWFYNEDHYDKSPMDGIGETIENVIFRKVKSRHVTVNIHSEFTVAVKKILLSISKVYMLANA